MLMGMTSREGEIHTAGKGSEEAKSVRKMRENRMRRINKDGLALTKAGALRALSEEEQVAGLQRGPLSLSSRMQTRPLSTAVSTSTHQQAGSGGPV